MTATSRDPRPKVADGKNSRPHGYKNTELSPMQLADCEALNAAYMRFNAGKPTRTGRVTDLMFATLAQSLGGIEIDASPHRQSWWRFRHGKEKIGHINMMIAAIVLQERPQDIFPTWPFSVLTELVPGERIPRLTRVIGSLAQMDRTALLYIVDGWLKAKRRERDLMLRTARRIYGDVEKKAAVRKAS